MAKKTSKKKSGKKSNKQSTKNKFWLKVKIFFWSSIFILTFGCLILVLNLPHSDIKRPEKANGVRQSKQTFPAVGSRSDQQRVKDKKRETPSPKKKRLYEEKETTKLSQITNEIDLAILQSLVLTGAGSQVLEHTKVNWRNNNGDKYLFQILQIRLDPPERNRFLSSLEDYLKNWVDKAKLKSAPNNDKVWQISLSNIVTHILKFKGSSHKEATEEPKEKALLALVIDDLGEDYKIAEQIIDLVNGQVTYSILPYCTYTQRIVHLVRNKALDFMLHLPMEPLKYPEIDPGPGSLFVDMSKTKIRKTLLTDLKQVPGSIGVSNHMGSRFTASRHGMSIVLEILKNKNLFFLDSLTNPESLVGKLAAEKGIDVISRDIFLDNEQNVKSIIFQLKKAEHLALQNGQAIAIGHPYPETVQALTQWMKVRDSRVVLCQLGQLIQATTKRRLQ